MNRLPTIALPLLLFLTPSAFAAEVESLASCTTKTLEEIRRTDTWAGKAPAGCSARVSVQRRSDALVVSASMLEKGAQGWVKTTFSAAASLAEVADAQQLAAASREILARSRRLAHCLKTLRSDEPSAECRARGSRNYLVGEESGIRDFQEISLDDPGRYAVVHYEVGDTTATPTLPEEFQDDDALPPGVEIKLRLNGTAVQ